MKLRHFQKEKIRQLSKNYGNTVALKNISLAFDKNGAHDPILWKPHRNTQPSQVL